MSLVDIRFIELSGEPIGGRRHARLATYGDTLTRDEFSAVKTAFSRFCTFTQNSVAKYHVVDRLLPGGMRVRMIANDGHYDVHVWVERKQEEVADELLPHAFVIDAPWCRKSYYCRERIPATWSVAVDPVQQLNALMWSTEQTLRTKPGEEGARMYSAAANSSTLWEYWRRPIPSDVPNAATPYRPGVVALRGTDGGYPLTPDFATDAGVMDASGALIKARPTSAPILALDPEDPVILPGAATGEGTHLVLQTLRRAVVSESFDIWNFRNTGTALTRGAGGYAETDTFLTNFSLPSPPIGAPAVFDNLGEKMPETVFYFEASIGLFGSIAPEGCPRAGPAATCSLGVKFKKVRTQDMWAGNTVFNNKDAHREVLTPAAEGSTIAQTEGQSVITQAMLLPEKSSVRKLDIEFRLRYPLNIFWRGGFESEYMDTAIYLFPPMYAGVHRFTMWRIDSSASVNFAPRATFKLGWVDLDFLEGTSTGAMTGNLHEDYTYTDHNYSFAENLGVGDPPNVGRTFASQDPGPVPPGTTCAVDGSTDTSNIWTFLRAVDEKPYFRTYVDKYPMNGTVRKPISESRPDNTVSYAFKSRYVIDYDQRAQFYAAIRVEVSCSGAHWVEGTVEGDMVPDGAPTYLVKIFFEAKWGTHDVVEQELYSQSHVRPGFEMYTLTKRNVYQVAKNSTLEIEYPTKVRLPPAFLLRGPCMAQLDALGVPQGHNPHLAAQDWFGTDEHDSDRGIEYSSRTEQHRKQPSGMLYARTFTVAEFSNALWLLHATGCSRSQFGDEELSYYYMPGFAEFSAQQHHIEMRDGEIMMWSDNIPATDGVTKPAPVSREIKLYRV